MRVLTDPLRSWSNYRKTIHGADPPCVPFIGVYQTDLTFIEGKIILSFFFFYY